MPQKQRIGLLALAAVVALVALIVVGTGGSDDEDVIDTRTQTTAQAPPPTTTTTPTTPTTETTQAAPRRSDPTVIVRDGRPVGGAERLRFRKGSRIVFVVRSDAAGEIHLHGYDIAKDVEAGGSVRFAVPARIDGRFELEVEETGALIAEIEVVP